MTKTKLIFFFRSFTPFLSEVHTSIGFFKVIINILHQRNLLICTPKNIDKLIGEFFDSKMAPSYFFT
jgi:hypothetical protein